MITSKFSGYVQTLAAILVLMSMVPLSAVPQSGPNGTLSGTVTDPPGL